MTTEKKHVLIVEDGILAADAMRIILEDSGYRVSLASTVQSALDVCLSDTPSVMLLDLTLPDGEGLEVLTGIDSKQGVRPERTIALTGHGELHVMKRCLDHGCEQVLIKPVSMRELLRIVREPPPPKG